MAASLYDVFVFDLLSTTWNPPSVSHFFCGTVTVDASCSYDSLELFMFGGRAFSPGTGCTGSVESLSSSSVVVSTKLYIGCLLVYSYGIIVTTRIDNLSDMSLFNARLQSIKFSRENINVCTFIHNIFEVFLKT